MTKSMKTITVTMAALLLLGCTMTAFAATYKYDGLGRVTEVTYDDGQTVDYTYDAAGNITSVETTTSSITGGGTSGTGGGTTSYPKQISVTMPDSSGNYTAQVPDYVKLLTGTDTFQFILGNATISMPVSALQTEMNAGAVRISYSMSGQDILSQATAVAPAHTNVINAINFNLTVNGNSVHDLNSTATVKIKLSDKIIAQLKKSGTPATYYFNTVAKTFTDMKAAFNLSAGTATFFTTHFGNYFIAVKEAKKTPIGVTYSVFIHGKGWIKAESNGATAGITGKLFEARAIVIKIVKVN